MVLTNTITIFPGYILDKDGFSGRFSHCTRTLGMHGAVPQQFVRKILDSQICNLTSTHNEEVMVLDASSIAHKLQLIGLVRYYLRGNLQGSLSFIVGTT